MVCFDSLEQFPSYFRLFVEACESWDYILSDKLVHFEQVCSGKHQSDFVAPELNDSGHCVWIEMHVWLANERKSHYGAIISRFLDVRDAHIQAREIQFQSAGVQRNVSVLVDVPECMQAVKMAELEGTPCIIRLKRFDDCDRISGQSRCGLVEFGKAVALDENRDDGKSCLQRGSPAVHHDKAVHEMVQRRAETANEISENWTIRGY